MTRGKIIHLNGASSAGKTSLVHALQATLAEPYFHLGVDNFAALVSRRELGAPAYTSDGLGSRFNVGFTACIAALAATGNNVIVDDVLCESLRLDGRTDRFSGRDLLKLRVQMLADYPMLFVGVHCPLAELERRERQRSDRYVGLAKFQFERVHAHAIYDLEVDTSRQSALDIAQYIQTYLEHGPAPDAYRQAVAALSQLLALQEQRGDDWAEEYARRLLALEPWDEAAHRALMRIYAGRGQRHAVLAQYTHCRRVLRDELGVEPERETVTLAEHLLAAPTAAAPVQRPAARKRTLPTPLTPLVNREHCLAELRAEVQRAEVRLITLTGAPGIGKTRLAVQVATDVRDAFPDGVYFVDLAPIRDPQLVLPAIAQTLELQEQGERLLLDQLSQAVRGRQVLLVLDNFEQVVDAGTQIAALLTDAPPLTVLVTSRAVLHLSGEHEFPVPPLEAPDPRHSVAQPAVAAYPAVELFVQRARAVNPTFRFGAAEAPAVAEICRRLDGLPLAIQLAAAHSKLLFPSGHARPAGAPADAPAGWGAGPADTPTKSAQYD